jgi:hypothetical protein
MSRITAATLALALSTVAATGGTFDVRTPEVTKGQVEFGVNTAIFEGYRENAERLRASTELSVGYGLTSWWKAGLKGAFDREVGGPFELTTVGIEQQFVLKPLSEGFGLGWYTTIDFSTISGSPHATAFGPILQLGTEKTSLSFNPFFVRTFGPNHEEGVAFPYAWQAKHEIREGLAFGIEGYGVVPNIANSPSVDFQEHRIGPVVYFERELPKTTLAPPSAAAPKIALEAGVLSGLTEGTQDVAVKVKGGITF